jgi:hypothetical protein
MIPEGTLDDIWLDDAGEVLFEQLSELLKPSSGSELLLARDIMMHPCDSVSDHIQLAAYTLSRAYSGDSPFPSDPNHATLCRFPT